MFGIGSTELLVILVVALVVLGPKSLPGIAKTAGKILGDFRRVSTEFQRTMNAEIAQEEHEKEKKAAARELFGDDGAPNASADTSTAKGAAQRSPVEEAVANVQAEAHDAPQEETTDVQHKEKGAA